MLDLPKGFPSRFGLAFVVLTLFVLLASGLSAQSVPTGALPTGANVLAGNADVSSLGNQMLIRQVSPRAAIRWNDFSVGSAASVEFLQPHANAAILNQVSGSNPSQILGRIRANGNVFITNGNGVFFGEQATVDVGGLVASTMNLAVKDFMNGKLTFKGENGDGEIWNKGRLSADPDGFIALLAPEVRNSGLILAKKGTVALASGKTVELQFGPQRKLEGIRVQPAKWKTLVENQHVIDAEEGLVVLSAKGLTSLRGSVVNNSGKIQARGVRRVGGRIMLTAGEGGEIENQGLLDVSSLHGKGGEAILEGERIHLDQGS
ncbi:MAG: filamentous hemagglutinin N-terminal domain-containing protein, partial [Verrucomicrobiota bacterium]|nr:filamentous hemagglutinin N-terminal domain-containing protein [Verrucomicrobiota bacterium]